MFIFKYGPLVLMDPDISNGAIIFTDVINNKVGVIFDDDLKYKTQSGYYYISNIKNFINEFSFIFSKEEIPKTDPRISNITLKEGNKGFYLSKGDTFWPTPTNYFTSTKIESEAGGMSVVNMSPKSIVPLKDGIYNIVSKETVLSVLIDTFFPIITKSPKEYQLTIATPRWSFINSVLTYHSWNDKDIEFNNIIIGTLPDDTVVVYNKETNQYYQPDGTFKTFLDGDQWFITEWISPIDYPYVKDMIFSLDDGLYHIKIGDKHLSSTGELTDWTENLTHLWRYRDNCLTSQKQDPEWISASTVGLMSVSKNILEYQTSINIFSCDDTEDCKVIFPLENFKRYILFPGGIFDMILGVCINPLTGVVPIDNTNIIVTLSLISRNAIITTNNKYQIFNSPPKEIWPNNKCSRAYTDNFPEDCYTDCLEQFSDHDRMITCVNDCVLKNRNVDKPIENKEVCCRGQSKLLIPVLLKSKVTVKNFPLKDNTRLILDGYTDTDIQNKFIVLNGKDFSTDIQIINFIDNTYILSKGIKLSKNLIDIWTKEYRLNGDKCQEGWCPFNRECDDFLPEFCGTVDNLGFPLLNTDINCSKWNATDDAYKNLGRFTGQSFCKENPTHPNCKCVNFDYSPEHKRMETALKAAGMSLLPDSECWAPSCTKHRNEPIIPERQLNSRQIAGSVCPALTICSQIVTVEKTGGDVIIDDNTFIQICGGSKDEFSKCPKMPCLDTQDCFSGVCVDKVVGCSPTCSINEECIDTKCVSKKCKVDLDCESGFCKDGVCADPASCDCKETETCVAGKCVEKICKYGDWGKWTDCIDGKQNRTKNLIEDAGGCDKTQRETQLCSKNIYIGIGLVVGVIFLVVLMRRKK